MLGLGLAMIRDEHDVATPSTWVQKYRLGFNDEAGCKFTRESETNDANAFAPRVDYPCGLCLSNQQLTPCREFECSNHRID